MPMSSDMKQKFVETNWDHEMRVGLAQARKIELKYKPLFPVSIAKQIVNDAILKTIKGDRTWNPDEFNLRRHLYMTISSLYSNEIRKALNAPKLEEYDESRGHANIPTAEEAVAIKSQVGLVIQELNRRRPDLYDFLHRCEEHGLFDGRESKDVAADMFMSAPNFSKMKKRLIQFLTELHAEFSSFGT